MRARGSGQEAVGSLLARDPKLPDGGWWLVVAVGKVILSTNRPDGARKWQSVVKAIQVNFRMAGSYVTPAKLFNVGSVPSPF